MPEMNVRLPAAAAVVGAVAVVVSCVMLGVGIGLAATPEPVVQTVVEEVPVEVQVVPLTCTAALDASEDVVRISVRALELSTQLIRNTTELQLQKMISTSSKLSGLSPALREPVGVYNRTNELCRSEADR